MTRFPVLPGPRKPAAGGAFTHLASAIMREESWIPGDKHDQSGRSRWDQRTRRSSEGAAADGEGWCCSVLVVPAIGDRLPAREPI